MKRHFLGKEFFLLVGIVLASCGGGGNSSSVSSSLTPAEGFEALTSGMNAFFSHENIGLNGSRHPDTLKTGKKSNDFSLTYTPVEPAVSDSSASEIPASASSISTSSDLNFSEPFTLGFSGWAAENYPVNFYLNGLSDSVGTEVLGYFHLDSPTLTFAQGDKSPVGLTDVAFTSYLDLNAFYLDLSENSYASVINSLVQSTPGNADWVFPVGNHGKITLNSGLSSALSYFLPLRQYLPKLTEAVVTSLKNDFSGPNHLAIAFKTGEGGIILDSAIPSFSEFYALLLSWTKAMANASSDNVLTQAANFAAINENLLKPLKKYGDCLSSFSLSTSLTYRDTGLREASFVLDATADLDQLKTAYALDNPSGFVTAFHGAGIFSFVVDDAAKIPTPKPALSTYVEIPPIAVQAA